MSETQVIASANDLEMMRLAANAVDTFVLAVVAIFIIVFIVRPLVRAAVDAEFERPADSGGMTITGQEANLLLSLLDDHMDGTMEIDGYPIHTLHGLRHRLFLAHEHPPEDTDDPDDVEDDPDDVEDCPMSAASGTEIERRFLVSEDNAKRLISHTQFHETWITQGYLATEPVVMRIRRSMPMAPTGPSTFVLTAKGNEPGMTRTEREIIVDHEMGQFLLDSTRSRVDKTRYRIDAGDGLAWELDQFHDHPGLFIAEIELPSEDTPIPHPDWLGPEITGDRSYSNVALAVDVTADIVRGEA